MDPNLAAFIGVALAVAIVPGPDMALVARNTLIGGRRVGAATVLGIVGGLLGWSAAAAVGIAAVLAASATAFTLLKLAGAAYLIYLGISTLRAGPVHDAGTRVRGAFTLRAAAAQGLLSAGLNPKLGVFFLTLLPQFVSTGAPAVRSLELALLFAAIGASWLLVYTYLIGSVGHVLSRPGPQRALRWFTGTVLVALGVRMALDRV